MGDMVGEELQLSILEKYRILWEINFMEGNLEVLDLVWFLKYIYKDGGIKLDDLFVCWNLPLL